jgi:hypothetical protein
MAVETIITETLNVIAIIAMLAIKREKVFFPATINLLAIKKSTFKNIII